MNLLPQKVNILIIVLLFQNCKSPNDKVYTNFEKSFNDAIEINNAEKFDYVYDNLRPQTAYFVGSKLKFLTLETSGESCDGKSLYLFNLHNDSLDLMIEQVVCYENADRGHKTTDTIYVTNFKNKTKEKFAKGVLATRRRIDKLEYNKYLYKVKYETEKIHNGN